MNVHTVFTILYLSSSITPFYLSLFSDVQTMPGFKNVLFGGEGLFVTTLTGPGTVWLQGMPPDRMISEIARRVPSGGGMGLGIPIGMGGGGDGGSAGEDGDAVTGDDEGAEGDEAGEDLVASTDADIEADRNATVASSGLYSSDAADNDDYVDSESSSALFGDAAPQQSSSDTQDIGGGGKEQEQEEEMAESSYFSTSDDDASSSTMPGPGLGDFMNFLSPGFPFSRQLYHLVSCCVCELFKLVHESSSLSSPCSPSTNLSTQG